MNWRSNVSVLRGSASARALLVALSTPLAMAPLSSAFAGGALPTNGQYVAGSGSIGKTGTNSLIINQSSNTGIINWKSFSIGKGNGVDFNNGAGATLNRVTGGDLSSIAGTLKATGSVYLINPQGVVVTGTGKVLTKGTFTASTGDVSDSDFLSRKNLKFSRTKGDVRNAGQIVSQSGDVLLIGHAVTNSGQVSARDGTAGLAAGTQIYFAPGGASGRILISGGTGSVTNTGSVAAASAELKAAGGNVYALSGNNGGIVRATGVSSANGHVWLTSGTGNVIVGGNVSAQNANGSGGTVTLRGVDIDAGGSISASATAARKMGGTVSIVAQDTTNVHGKIAAEGGEGSKGGFIETSGEHLHVADNAKINTLAKDGLSGDWLIDPNDFTIAASGGDITGATLSSELASSNITISSTSGAHSGHGDIFVNDAVSWSSNQVLTFNASRNIDFNANVTATGTSAGLVLVYGGNYNFANGTSVTLSGSSETLKINSTSYTLLHSVSQLQAINTNGTTLSGNYALAQNLNATGISSWVPLGTDGTGNVTNGGHGFNGTFAGLGNHISNLTINIGTGNYAGLFGVSGGTIRDVGLSGGSVTGNNDVGGLVGLNLGGGTIIDAFATGNVSGGSMVGGLAGDNSGTITNAFATGNVSGGGSQDYYIGGLTGDNGGTITGSHASGAVVGGGDVGGLAGRNEDGTVSNSYATGAVSGSGGAIGGLVGESFLGTIASSHATGAVSATGDASKDVGGLVGLNDGINGLGGTIKNVYATGAVSAPGSSSQEIGGLVGWNYGNITIAHATGAVSGNSYVGGLVGLSGNIDFPISQGDGNATITNAYATGAVTGSSGGNDVGGLVGLNEGAITSVHAGGAIIASGTSDMGGLVGENAYGTIKNAYATGKVSGDGTTSSVGGLVGSNFLGTISNANATGAISGHANVGGLVGDNHGTITNAHATGAVKGIEDSSGDVSEAIGGLAGQSVGTISNVYATGTVSGDLGIGGLIGEDDSGFTSAYATGAVSGYANVGGLVGNESGNITNAHATGAVSGKGVNNDGVGGLVGSNSGNITAAWSTGVVSAIDDQEIGGLVGVNYGNIKSTYATGKVIGSVGVGGLVGVNIVDSGTSTKGTIANSYATGAVRGSSHVGGLVGDDYGGNIFSAYATGSVSGSSDIGGLAGSDEFYYDFGSNTQYNPQISHSYWDTDTSGLPTGIGTDDSHQSSNVTGEHTAQLQGALPSGFSNTVWSTGTGLYPYLTWQSPTGTPQAISGYAYSDYGVTALNGGSVSLLIGGAAMGSASTGANGYYYFLEAPGTVSNSQVLTYLSGTGGAALAQNASGSVSGLNISKGVLTATTAATSYSAFKSTFAANLSTAIGSNSVAQTIVNGLGLEIVATGSGFAIDQSLNEGTKALSLVSHGGITETGSGSITAASLSGSALGAVTLTAANNITNLGAFAASAGLSLTDANSLIVNGAVTPGSGALTLTTIGSGHNLTIDAAIGSTAHIVKLTSAGYIVQNSAGIISASTLTGSSVDYTSLTAANNVANLYNYSVGGAKLMFVDSRALSVSGTVQDTLATGTLGLTTTAGNLTINGNLTSPTITLTTAGEALEGSAGAISASKTLNVTAQTGINLNSTHNHIHSVGTRKTTSGPNVINGIGM